MMPYYSAADGENYFHYVVVVIKVTILHFLNPLCELSLGRKDLSEERKGV